MWKWPDRGHFFFFFQRDLGESALLTIFRFISFIVRALSFFAICIRVLFHTSRPQLSFFFFFLSHVAGGKQNKKIRIESEEDFKKIEKFRKRWRLKRINLVELF
jgi:hypothetical protein